MNKFFKRIVSMVGALALTAGLTASAAACSKGGNSATLIGVGLYEDSGAAVTAVKNYLGSLENELNVKFSYTTLSQTDEATNKTAAQNMISAGCKGIILTMDSATSSILDEAKKAGIYVGGYLNDYNTSYDSIKGNPNFVGTVVDGRYEGFAWGREIAERIINDGHKTIGMVKFPAFAFPHQSEMDQAFREEIAKYNETAAADKKITVKDTVELMFQPLPTTYLDENSDIDAIFGMCAGVQFIYPTLVSAKKTNVKLYTAGLVCNNDIYDNFGTKGNACIQEMVFSNAEAITYPLVMLLNKIRGNTFSDQPAEAQRVDSSQMRITNNEELDFCLEHSLQFTGKVSDAFLTPAEVKALLAENGGTHEKLVAAVQSMSVADLKAKVNKG